MFLRSKNIGHIEFEYATKAFVFLFSPRTSEARTLQLLSWFTFFMPLLLGRSIPEVLDFNGKAKKQAIKAFPMSVSNSQQSCYLSQTYLRTPWIRACPKYARALVCFARVDNTNFVSEVLFPTFFALCQYPIYGLARLPLMNFLNKWKLGLWMKLELVSSRVSSIADSTSILLRVKISEKMKLSLLLLLASFSLVSPACITYKKTKRCETMVCTDSDNEKFVCNRSFPLFHRMPKYCPVSCDPTVRKVIFLSILLYVLFCIKKRKSQN